MKTMTVGHHSAKCQHLMQALDINMSQIIHIADPVAVVDTLKNVHVDVLVYEADPLSEHPVNDAGMDWVRQLREHGREEPVVVLNAPEGSDWVIGYLQAGADEVAQARMGMPELAARVEAIVRRCTARATDVYKVGDLVMDTRHQLVERNGEAIHLTSKEWSVLALLMRNNGKLVPRERIAQQVWDRHMHPSSNLIDSFVARVRKKIDRNQPVKLIHTLKNQGYMIRGQKTEGGCGT